MTEWELDFKENRFAIRTPDGTRQHMIEVLVTSDTGTSILVNLTVHDAVTVENASRCISPRTSGRPGPHWRAFCRSTTRSVPIRGAPARTSPHTAFPEVPSLPAVPALVDPDGWLARMDGLRFTRQAAPGWAAQW